MEAVKRIEREEKRKQVYRHMQRRITNRPFPHLHMVEADGIPRGNERSDDPGYFPIWTCLLYGRGNTPVYSGIVDGLVNFTLAGDVDSAGCA